LDKKLKFIKKVKFGLRNIVEGQLRLRLKKVGKTKKHGTIITFEPDPEIFPEIEWNWNQISEYLRNKPI